MGSIGQRRARLPMRRRKGVAPSTLRPSVVNSWRDGLKHCAAAVCGRDIADRDSIIRSAWGLAPGPWAYVYNRVNRHEDGWRRRRGLSVLRRIQKLRRTLVPPIHFITCNVCWLGCTDGKRAVVSALRQLIAKWREMGLHVPVAKHSKVQFSWAATPTFCSAVSNGHSLPQLITDQNSPECPCARYLGSNATWPTVTVGGVRHTAASKLLFHGLGV